MDETRGLGFAGPLVADPKLAAGRGKEFSAAHLVSCDPESWLSKRERGGLDQRCRGQVEMEHAGAWRGR